MFLFQAFQAWKMCFRILQKEKTPFQVIKTRCSKTRKFEVFSKGVVHGFGRKLAIFACLYFRQQSPGKCVLRYSRRKKTPFQTIKTRSSKSRKIDIFPKGLTHGFGPKMAIFPTFFLKAIQGRKMCCTMLQNEKTPFQAIKTRS